MSRSPLPARILIPVANPLTAEELIRLGSALLDKRAGELTALGIVEVPEGMPLSEGATRARHARRLLQRVLDYAPEGDYLAYQTMALNVLSGHGVLDQFGNLAMMNAGYPLFVLVPVFAVFNNSVFAAQIANAVLGAVGIALTYAVAKEAGADRTGRLLQGAQGFRRDLPMVVERSVQPG